MKPTSTTLIEAKPSDTFFHCHRPEKKIKKKKRNLCITIECVDIKRVGIREKFISKCKLHFVALSVEKNDLNSKNSLQSKRSIEKIKQIQLFYSPFGKLINSEILSTFYIIHIVCY